MQHSAKADHTLRPCDSLVPPRAVPSMGPTRFARREFFAVQTVVALVAALFILTNTVIDVLYTAVDPRVKADDDK